MTNRTVLTLISSIWLTAGWLAAGASCTKTEPAADKAAATKPAAKTAAVDKAATSAAQACRGAEAKGPLSWFSDQYSVALTCARQTRRPLIIDLWAKWCHTCLSMKQTVLQDPGLEPLADRFVWLELDTDKEVNAPAVAKFPPQVWPTFYVVGPGDESVQGRYLGAASVGQFRAFLTQGEKAVLAAGDLKPGSPLSLLRDGDRAMAQREWTAARNAYAQALKALPADSPRRPDVLVSLVSAYYKSGDYAGCTKIARDQMNHTGRSASAADFLYYGAICASKLGSEDGSGTTPPPANYQAEVKALRHAALARLSDIVGDPQAPMSVDDRGDAMRIAREIMVALDDQKGARAMAERQRTLLDEAAASAPNAFAAMTFNWPRAEVYVYLGKAAELVPALEKSAADLPNEYDPPYRLAWVLFKLGKNDKALAAGQEALKLAYGPRKARVQGLVADIHAARGDKTAERSARKAVVAILEGLQDGHKNPAALAAARDKLAALDQINQ